jgi:hypothetical protein
MKNKLVMSVLLGCGVLASTLPTSAQGNSGTNNAVPNVQRYDARFTLTPTPEAPAGAKGKAAIKSESTDGNQTATLSLQTQGLDAGDYTITAVTADGSVTLGQITIEDPSNGNGRGRGRLRSDSQVELTDVVANDITQLIVSDTNGVDMLVGNLTAETSKSKATFSATVPLTPGEAAPEASGFAKLKSSLKNGTIKNNFVLIASGLATNTTYTVDVDGTDAGTVTSNKKGKAIVKKLPSTITTISTVRLLDPDGIEAVRADF